MIARLGILLIIFCAISDSTLAQTNDVDTKEYEAHVEDLGYNKTKKALRLRKKFHPQPIDEQERKTPTLKGALTFFQIIAYALIIILVIAIIYLIFANVKVDKKLDPFEDDFKEIENIEEVDAEANYKAALAAGNYRLAIRMHFILCLQKLSADEIIDWEKEKKNRHYYREITDTEIKYDFRNIANIFERCWYSDLNLDLTGFKNYDQRFVSFLNKLK